VSDEYENEIIVVDDDDDDDYDPDGDDTDRRIFFDSLVKVSW